ILVIPTFLLSMLGALTLDKILYATNRELLWDKYKRGLLIVGGVFAVALLVYATSDFSADADKSLLQQVNSIPDAQQ
ncbi:hypothetical protein ABTF55_22125, partial [Acinetobacter baumannii]